MENPNDFFNKLFSNTNKNNEATILVSLMREFKSLDTFLGAEYDIFDRKGELIYTIKKRRITTPQLNALLEEYGKIMEDENKRYKKKK